MWDAFKGTSFKFSEKVFSAFLHTRPLLGVLNWTNQILKPPKIACFFWSFRPLGIPRYYTHAAFVCISSCMYFSGFICWTPAVLNEKFAYGSEALTLSKCNESYLEAACFSFTKRKQWIQTFIQPCIVSIPAESYPEKFCLPYAAAEAADCSKVLLPSRKQLHQHNSSCGCLSLPIPLGHCRWLVIDSDVREAMSLLSTSLISQQVVPPTDWWHLQKSCKETMLLLNFISQLRASCGAGDPNQEDTRVAHQPLELLSYAGNRDLLGRGGRGRAPSIYSSSQGGEKTESSSYKKFQIYILYIFLLGPVGKFILENDNRSVGRRAAGSCVEAKWDQ